eukprot:11270991-Ditylum_brightwellii.AAC.1
MSMYIPDTPPANLPRRKSLLILGTLPKDAILMDKSCSKSDQALKAPAKAVRDERDKELLI